MVENHTKTIKILSYRALHKLSWKCRFYRPAEPLTDTPYSMHHNWHFFLLKRGNITLVSRKHPEFTSVILIFLISALNYQWRNEVRVLGRSQWGHSSGRLCQQGSILVYSLQVVNPLHFPLFLYTVPSVWNCELVFQIWRSLFPNWLSNGRFMKVHPVAKPPKLQGDGQFSDFWN